MKYQCVYFIRKQRQVGNLSANTYGADRFMKKELYYRFSPHHEPLSLLNQPIVVTEALRQKRTVHFFMLISAFIYGFSHIKSLLSEVITVNKNYHFTLKISNSPLFSEAAVYV